MLKQGFSLLTALNLPPRHVLLRLAVITICIIAAVTWYINYQPGLAFVGAAVGLFLAIRGWKHLKQVKPLPDETDALRAVFYDLAILICGGLCLIAMGQFFAFFISMIDAPRPAFEHFFYGLGALIVAVPFGIAINNLQP